MSMHGQTNSDSNSPDQDAPAPGPTHARMRTTLHSVSAMQAIALPQAHDRLDRSSRTDGNPFQSRPFQSQPSQSHPSQSQPSQSQPFERLAEQTRRGRTHRERSWLANSPTHDDGAARAEHPASGTHHMPLHGFVVAVVAAHEAEASITSTLRALNGQSRPVDAVIVVTDNCADHTALMALAAGATIVDAAGNGHGRHGALNLALAEVVDMLDDTDAVLILNEDTCLDQDFVARATRHLWTPNPRSPVAAVVGRLIPDLGVWSVAAQCRRNDQLGDLVGPAHTAVYRVGALRKVIADRRDLRLPDRTATAGVFDPEAVAPDIELAIALQSCGYDVVESVDCRASTTDARSSGRTVFDSHKQHHHGLLDALSAHGLRRPLTRTLITEARSLLAVAVVPAVVCTIAISAARADMPPWALALLAATVTAWMARRVWSVRSDGWRAMATVTSVMPELVRSAVAGAGRLAGSTRWLHDVPSLWGRRRPRQPTWAHGQDRPGGFDPPKAPSRSGRRSRARISGAPNAGAPTAGALHDGTSTGTLSLVRMPGPAVVIERIHDDVDDPTTGGGWRNHAVVALAVAMTIVITVGVPLASLSVAWAMLIAAATISIVVNVTSMVTSPDD